MKTADLFADDPVDGTPEAPDRLSRATFADHIVTLLGRVREQSDSSVLSLIGAWGSGKSSVLDMVQLRLPKVTVSSPSGEAASWLVINFNPWTFGDAESLQDGFFRELRNALPDEAKWSEARKRIGDFGKAIAPFAVLIPGVSAENAVKAAGEAIAGDQSFTALKAAAEKALADLGRPILFVMDDLDRLTPSELLLIFKLVRLVGRLPHVYYLLSYDESTLLDVLSRTDLVPLDASRDKRRARDYLEKIIQVRLDLPALREQQAVELVDESLTHVLQSNGVTFNEGNMDRFRTAFHDHIRRRLDTPRAINRYFAQVDAIYVLLGEEVDLIDFLLLTWVRTSEPELFAALQSRRRELTRRSFPLTASASKETHQQALTQWSNLLVEKGVAAGNIDGVLSVLSQMFLPIRSARENMDWTEKAWYDEVRSRRGVGHIDYFDRYFSFSVPEDDIPDSVVRAAMGDLAGGASTPAVDRMRSQLIADPGRVCRKIATEHEQDRAPAAEVLWFLADLYADLPSSGTALLDPKRSVQFLAADLLTDVPSDQGPDVLRRMSNTALGVCLMAEVVARARHGSSTDEGKKTIDWMDEASTTAAILVRSRLDATEAPVKELDEDLWRLIHAWRWLDEEATRQWVREAAHAKSGWQLIDVLARMTAPAHMDGGSMAALNMTEVETFVGVDFAISELPMGDAASVEASHDLEPTWENRQRLARSLIDEERQRRATASTPTDDDN